MKKQIKAVIVGAGIGGLAVARALEKIGLDYVVLEQSLQISEVGTGITIWSNGTHCLKNLGLGDQFEEKAFPLRGSTIQNHRGQILAVLDFTDFKDRFGADSVMIHRADLINILAKSIPEEKVFLNSKVQSFEEDSKGVTVKLVSGEKIKGDILIGADGIHSIVRKGLDNRQPRYAGYTCWRGLFPMDKNTSFEKNGILAMGSGNEFGFAQLNKHTGYWFATALARPDSSKELNLENLKKAFSNWSENIREMIDQTPSDSIIRNDILDLTPRKNWGLGRHTLLGDSAHGSTPHLAQGGCMALEDALVLAWSLLKNSDEKQALRTFEKKRYARTAAVIRESRFIGKVAHWKHPFLTKIRELTYLSIHNRILQWSIKKYVSYRPPSLF